MSNDVQDHIEDYRDDPDDPVGGADDAGGTTVQSTLLGHPDQSAVAAVLQAFRTELHEAINRDREFYASLGKNAFRVNPNLSGSVQFGRYSLNSVVPQQIVREKPERGDTVIVCYSGTAYIGLHAGIIPGGTDTVTIVANAGRTIRTRLALWAVGDGVIDVQEEFD